MTIKLAGDILETQSRIGCNKKSSKITRTFLRQHAFWLRKLFSDGQLMYKVEEHFNSKSGAKHDQDHVHLGIETLSALNDPRYDKW